MRVLHITAHYPPDFTSGATLQISRIATTMAAAGHDVTVLAGAINARLADGETRDQDIDGVRVRWVGTADRIMQDDDANWVNPLAAEVVATLIDELRPEVVHAHALQTLGADLLRETFDRLIPTVVTMHDLWWWCPRLFLVDRQLQPCPLDTRSSACECSGTADWRRRRAAHLMAILADVDQVLVPSSALRDVAITNGLAADVVDVDENDVDASVLVAVDPAGGALRAGNDVRFVYVGGDHPLKGRDVLLAAARRLGRTPGWSLTMYGVEPRRGRSPARWRRPSPVRSRPSYPPTETAAVLGAADVVVIPSIARESFSLAAREALAAGAAVISSDCLGPEEVVHHDVNGLVVPTGDVQALAEAMRRVIDEPALLDRLRRSARSHPPRLRSG